MIEASVIRYWIARIGRLVGRARIADFLCEMLVRLYARGLCSMEGFEVPLAQTNIAEICGMTPVACCPNCAGTASARPHRAACAP